MQRTLISVKGTGAESKGRRTVLQPEQWENAYEDDIYENMRLPKGCVVIANVRNMLHDPAVFPNPEDFDPGRYHNLNSEMEKVTDLVFGFGRRACPGRTFAEGTVFAIIVTVLATCDVLPVVDVEGKVSVPDVTLSSGTFSSPSGFKCKLKYRSEHSREMLGQGLTMKN
ncbi:cytochrome P450 [Mycena filopes]|nr:cytochrome P450 [Mycena filopes]